MVTSREGVEAALLDSEGDPEEEIQAALDAVAEFALVECEATEEGFLRMAQQAWKAAEKEAKDG